MRGVKSGGANLLTPGGPSVLDSEGISYVLRGYTDLGSGDTFVEDKHPSTARRHTLPGENEVIAVDAPD